MHLTSKNTTITLIFLSFISSLIIIGNIFIAISLNQELENTNFKLNPIMIPKFNKSQKILEINPMKKFIFTKSQMEDFTKKLIMEYITVRYSVTPSTYLMQINTGIDSPDNSLYGNILKLPTLRMDMNYNSYFTQAHTSFTTGKTSDSEDIKKLMSENTTRSVRILRKPEKYKDKYKTIAEFIYKYPDNFSIKDAPKEIWEISMEIEPLTGFRPLTSVTPTMLTINPASIFGFQINTIEKIRK